MDISAYHSLTQKSASYNTWKYEILSQYLISSIYVVMYKIYKEDSKQTTYVDTNKYTC